VSVVAVTKGQPPAAVVAARALGLLDVGENYAQELLAKIDALPPGPAVRWHFLGRVQRNKVPRLAPLVDCWQSLARLAEGQAIARRRPGARVLVELDTTDRPGRGGCPPDELPYLVEQLGRLELSLEGLMTVGPPDVAGAERAFATLATWADRLGLSVRSMGMSDDLELAVAHGSTMVRIGRGLFGDRPGQAAGVRPWRWRSTTLWPEENM
jgi:PLP dependent protein